MKRSPIKRGTKRLRAKKPLQRSRLTPAGRSFAEALNAATREMHLRGMRTTLQAIAPTKKRAPLRKIGRRGRAAKRELDKVREAVFHRAGDRCERCRERGCLPLDLHHKLSRARGGTHDVDNLVALGRRCHDEITFSNPPDRDRWILTGKKPPR